jgi:hypothetical protein
MGKEQRGGEKQEKGKVSGRGGRGTPVLANDADGGAGVGVDGEEGPQQVGEGGGQRGQHELAPHDRCIECEK